MDDILVLAHSKDASKRTFLSSLLVCLGLHINFSKSELHLTWQLLFGAFGVIQVTFLSPAAEKSIEIQQLVHTLLQRHPVTVCEVISFLGKTTFLPLTCTALPVDPCHSE